MPWERKRMMMKKWRNDDHNLRNYNSKRKDLEEEDQWQDERNVIL